jgi:hypothetical protein
MGIVYRQVRFGGHQEHFSAFVRDNFRLRDFLFAGTFRRTKIYVLNELGRFVPMYVPEGALTCIGMYAVPEFDDQLWQEGQTCELPEQKLLDEVGCLTGA